MNPCGPILLTGITGSLGSVLAGQILRSGTPVKAVVRPDGKADPRSRVKETLELMGIPFDGRQIEVISGDVCRENLGISVKLLSGVSRVVHCAALLDFAEDSAAMNHRVNVIGTRNILRLAELLGVSVCHISTAYVSGTREDLAREDQLDVGQAFHNPYESSKCRAEQEVREWSKRTGLSVMIFRPSILVGDSKDGRIVHFDGLYNLMRFFDSVAELIRREDFRAAANPLATKNLMPVDIAAEMIWKIMQSQTAGVYHITHPQPISLKRLRDIFVELFDLPRAQLVSPEDFAHHKPSRYERMFQKASLFYQPYLRHEPAFDRTQTERALSEADRRIPALDLTFFRRLLDYARRRNWGVGSSEIPAVVDPRYGRLVQDYFGRFLAGKMHQHLLQDLRGLTATCRIHITLNPAEFWSLRIDQGRLEQISQNGLDSQCTFVTDGATFEQIVSGRLAPQQAFFRKKVEITGNMETGMKLATVLAAFFRKHPYPEGDRHA
jgi:thioester reductase-like protein